MNINKRIQQSIQTQEILALPDELSDNFSTFENQKQLFENAFKDAQFILLNKEELTVLFSSKVKGISQQTISDTTTPIPQNPEINIICLYQLFLILEINHRLNELSPELGHIFQKLQQFFNWDTSTLPSLKKQLNTTYTKYFSVVNVLVLMVYLFWQINTSGWEMLSSKFPIYCLVVLFIAFAVLIYKLIQNRKIPEQYKTYPVDFVFRFFQEKVTTV